MLNEKKVALITGINGQDGSYLAEFLLSKGYYVRGIVRRSSSIHSGRIEHLLKKMKYGQDPSKEFVCYHADLTDASSLRNIIEKVQPDEVYNLAAQSHVGISFENPATTFDINALGTLRLLDAIHHSKLKCKYYQASSSEMFGASPPPQNEETPFKPQSPYGVSKVAAFNFTRMYRVAYGLFASNGILFNHESPRRGINFATRKITRELARIVLGHADKIVMGNLDAKRDWGHSEEYVKAMWAILQHHEPDDFVIATEETHTVREFLEEAFSLLGLDYNNYVEVSDRYKRPAEVPALLGDASKAKRLLGWSPKIKFKELVQTMVEADLKEQFEENGMVLVNPENNNHKGFYIEKAKDFLIKRGILK
ncbi:MAG: GDP-mannose 4,6-dehydratase [Nanoarchaeota archaeon]